MKIIQILAGKANPKTTMNGVNVVVDKYACMMYERGYDVEVWGIADNPNTNLPSPKYPLRFFRQYHSWPCKLDNRLVECLESIDGTSTVIHFHGGFIREFSKIAERMPELRYFTMPHGVYAKKCFRQRLWLKWPYWSMIEKRFISKSCGLLLLHEAELCDKIARSLDGVAKYVIPNGADSRLVIKGNEDSITKQTETVIWGYCGRIDDAHKGIDLMIRSFIRFVSKADDKKHILSIVGDGPDLNHIRKRYSAQINSGMIKFHGKLFEEQKVEKLRQMRFFFHLSNWDGMPLACLDALAMGIPLIVTPETNLVEDVRAYGAGVATLPDENTVVRAMQRLVNMNRQSLAESCLRLVKGKYNWETSCDKLVSLYEAVL